MTSEATGAYEQAANRRPLQVSDVAELVTEIEAMAADPEAAHSAEDDLYVRVLREIAEGCRFPRRLAATALQAAAVEFPRWCA